MNANVQKNGRRSVKEGFTQIAAEFEGVAAIEKHHEERYNALLKNIKSNKVFKKATKEAWICLNCGNIVYGKEAPKLCGVCKHPQSYFKVLKQDY